MRLPVSGVWGKVFSRQCVRGCGGIYMNGLFAYIININEVGDILVLVGFGGIVRGPVLIRCGGCQ